MRRHAATVVLACALAACGIDARGTAPVGAADAAALDAAAASEAGAGADGGGKDASPAADAADGAASYTCSPPPPWASDCANGVPCISSIGDSEKCVDRRTDSCLMCKGAICCVIGDSTIRCIEDPSQCK